MNKPGYSAGLSSFRYKACCSHPSDVVSSPQEAVTQLVGVTLAAPSKLYNPNGDCFSCSRVVVDRQRSADLLHDHCHCRRHLTTEGSAVMREWDRGHSRPLTSG